jgi:SAM-dependent methyltransferase
MKINNLIDIVKEKNKSLETQFYNKCIDKLSHLDKDIINEIPEDKYILEPIRLYINEQSENYYLYISDEITDDIKNKEILFRTIKLTDNGLHNLLQQLYVIETDDLSNFCEKHPYELKNIYFIISSQSLSGLVELKNKEQCLQLFMGMETLNMLNLQNLNNFCKYFTMARKDQELSIDLYKSMYNFSKTMDNDSRNRFMIFSGFILQTLGTTYTGDIDVIYYATGQTEEVKENMIKKMEENDIDYHIIDNNTISKPDGKEVRSYLYDWIVKYWPQRVGIDNISETFVDPEYHYYFTGIKMINIKMTIERIKSRSSAPSIVDLIMLNKINKIKTDICFPNLSIRGGKITIYDNKLVRRILNTVKNYLKQWFNINTNISTLKEEIKKCSELPHYIYSKVPERNHITNYIIKYNSSVMMEVMRKYFNYGTLLDIGSGPLRGLWAFKKNKIGKLIGIEPSKESIKTGYTNIENFDLGDKIIQINGFGNDPWINNDKYSKVFDNEPYDYILFKFTIHYMIHNIDVVLKNISSIDKQGTIIIISCLDGNLVQKKLNKSDGRYEIVIKDEPWYGVYNFDPSEDGMKQVMVYFKGVYGVDQGSIESLVDVDKLIEQLGTIGYTLLEDFNFSKYNNPKINKIKKKLSYKQKLITDLHRCIVLEKTQSGGNWIKYINNRNNYLELKNKTNNITFNTSSENYTSSENFSDSEF